MKTKYNKHVDKTITNDGELRQIEIFLLTYLLTYL